MISATAALPRASAISSSVYSALRRREHPREGEERHDGEVLEQQHAEGESAMRPVELVLLGELAQHDRGRGHRDRAAEQDRDRQRETEHPADCGDDSGGAEDLQAAQREHLAAHRDQPRQRELEPEREEQEHDAELGERVGRLGRLDPAERVRADDHADQQEGEDQGKAQAPQAHDDGERRHEQQQDVFQDAVFQGRLPLPIITC